ncbi:hypothetical protein EXS74_02750 [Candidatus Woesearchaeota archaeon]|nr:hypothetical protein [Candidatus Woesearchaeota archaeon]
MLNKKAQTEDLGIEIPFAIVLTIIGVIALTLVAADYNWSTDRVKGALHGGTTVHAFDAKFMGTDLENTLKLQVGDYTFGELIAYMPRNYQEVQDPSLFEGMLWDKWLIDGLACDQELYTEINHYLSPVYGKYWQIKAYYHDEEIFSCYPADILYGFGPIQTNMILPTLDPQETVFVQLKVYQ